MSGYLHFSCEGETALLASPTCDASGAPTSVRLDASRCPLFLQNPGFKSDLKGETSLVVPIRDQQLLWSTVCPNLPDIALRRAQQRLREQ